MASSVSAIALITAILSLFSILLTFIILKKVYQENYRRPWLFIGITALFFGLSQLLRFLEGFYSVVLVSPFVTEVLIFVMEFIAVAFLAYGLLLEYFMLEYVKGKFVKMKFIPVQEGSLGGELDINVTQGKSYFAFKKERKFLFEQFSEATKKGFEGFLLTEENPKSMRSSYGIAKSPIAWISQIDKDANSEFVKGSLDENSDSVAPLQLNDLISYIDNFLEQSAAPFILLELNLILKVNSFAIVYEFLQYLKSRTERYNGILICALNTDVISQSQKEMIKKLFLELE